MTDNEYALNATRLYISAMPADMQTMTNELADHMRRAIALHYNCLEMALDMVHEEIKVAEEKEEANQVA